MTDAEIDAGIEAEAVLRARGSEGVERLAGLIAGYTQEDMGHARAAVRVVLRAMREPSADALGRSPIIDTWTDETGWHTGYRSALASWQVMIDYVLGEAG